MSTTIYVLWVSMYVCVCVCVCRGVGGGGGERRILLLLFFQSWVDTDLYTFSFVFANTIIRIRNLVSLPRHDKRLNP